jgi:hypothetical protein
VVVVVVMYSKVRAAEGSQLVELSPFEPQGGKKA